MVLHTRRKATPARNLFPFKVPTFLLRKCTVIGPFFPQPYLPDSKENERCFLCFIFDRFQQTQKMFFWELDPFALMEPYVTMVDVTARIGRQLQIDHQAPKHCVFSCRSWASSRETTENAFWQRILAKSGVFCHRWHNHSHIDKNVGKTKRSK